MHPLSESWRQHSTIQWNQRLNRTLELGHKSINRWGNIRSSGRDWGYDEMSVPKLAHLAKIRQSSKFFKTWLTGLGHTRPWQNVKTTSIYSHSNKTRGYYPWINLAGKAVQRPKSRAELILNRCWSPDQGSAQRRWRTKSHVLCR